jgi:hypothetical protein
MRGQLNVVNSPRIDTTSTLLLSNHISVLDYKIIAAALHNTAQAVPRVVLRDDAMHPDEKEGDVPMHNPDYRLLQMAKHRFVYSVLKAAVGAIPIRRTDSVYPSGVNTPRGYLNAIKRGEDVLIFPMAKVTRDGSIDYVSETSKYFEDRHTIKIMNGHAPIHVAFIHLLRDPVFKQYAVTFGESYTAEDLPSLSFVDEQKKCTTLTGLQIYHFLDRRPKGITLKDAIIKLRAQRFNIVPNITPSEITKAVFAFNPWMDHKDEDLDLNQETVEVASPDYQYNSIKHIIPELERILRA